MNSSVTYNEKCGAPLPHALLSAEVHPVKYPLSELANHGMCVKLVFVRINYLPGILFGTTHV